MELQLPVEKVGVGLAVLETQPRVVRELLLRRIAEAGLAGQRRAHDRKGMNAFGPAPEEIADVVKA